MRRILMVFMLAALVAVMLTFSVGLGFAQDPPEDIPPVTPGEPGPPAGKGPSG